MQYDELAHMGVKGMKWRKGRKTSRDAGKQLSDSVKVYEKRQSQLQSGFGVGADVGSKIPKSKLSKPDTKQTKNKTLKEKTLKEKTLKEKTPDDIRKERLDRKSVTSGVNKGSIKIPKKLRKKG